MNPAIILTIASFSLAILGWRFPLALNTLSREQKARTDKKGLSRFMFVSFGSTGVLMIVLSLLEIENTFTPILIFLASVITITACSVRYASKK